MPDYSPFQFTSALLGERHPPGISAYMRIKNEEQFVALSILSHLDYYDEIIACYNDCSDNTEKILRERAKQIPNLSRMW